MRFGNEYAEDISLQRIFVVSTPTKIGSPGIPSLGTVADR